MIDRAVLDALAGAVDRGGDLETALAGLRRVDPLLRGAARRRLRTAHADALLATRLKQGPEASRHALRLTYLLVARTLPPRAARDDLAALEAAFEETRARAPRAAPALWWPTGLAVIALLAAAAGVATFLPRGPKPAAASSSAASARSEPPSLPVRGAFADGGVPAPAPGDAVIARALGKDLPDFIVALDGRSEARSAGTKDAEAEAEIGAARDRALSPEVREALGPGAARALAALFPAAAAAAESAPEGLGEAAAALDDELAAQGLGYFVDADVVVETGGRRRVLVYSFRVAQVSIFSADGLTVRALHLRRLDKLNWSHTLLGFTRPTLRSAAVLLDQLDAQVVTLLAPALAEGAPLTLYDPDASAEERAAVEGRAGELVREEFLPGLDRAAAAKLGKLLGKRRALFAAWEKLAAARGMTLTAPGKLRLPEGFRRSLAGLAPRDDLDELARIDAALDDRTREDAFAAIRDTLASSVERHEVQHRLDAARTGIDGGRSPIPTTAENAELSAYLAELARDARTPRVGLALIARFLLDRRMHGTAESYAAVTVLQGLGGLLGARTRAPLVVDSAVDRRAVAALWLELVALPPERLRGAARTLWPSLFSTALPDLRKIAPPG